MEQAGQIISRLEGEKLELEQQTAQLDQQLSELETLSTERSQAEDTLNQEIKMLTSHLSLKDRKLQDLEARLLKTDQDLDVKLATSLKEVQTGKKQIKELLDENRQIRQQITDLSRHLLAMRIL